MFTSEKPFLVFLVRRVFVDVSCEDDIVRFQSGCVGGCRCEQVRKVATRGKKALEVVVRRLATLYEEDHA